MAERSETPESNDNRAEPTAFEEAEGRRPELAAIEDPASPSPEDERVAALLNRTIDVPVLAEAVEQQEAADAADTLEHLEEEEAAELLVAMDERPAAEALAEMQAPLAARVIEDLLDEGNAKYAGLLLRLMAPDDAADLLQSIDEALCEAVLRAMPVNEAVELRELAGYAEDTAAGLMTTDFLALNVDMTVAQATEAIRASSVPEQVHHLPVVDATGRLRGLVSLRMLLINRDDRPVADLLESTFRAIRPDLDQETVAHEFDRYDLFMLPVVDAADRLLGLVTVDDVIDIIRAEHTEDVQKSVGAGKGEAVYSGLGEKLRGRFPWLLVNLVTSSVAAIVVLRFEPLIKELAILAVLMPVIANQAGNAGQQSLAVTLRGIVLGEVREGRVFRLMFREALVGMVNGLVAGLLVCAAVTILGMLVSGITWRIGAVAAFSMLMALTVATLTGCSLPILMRRLGRDPATASTIFLTMVTDSFSFLAFLGSARLLTEWIM